MTYQLIHLIRGSRSRRMMIGRIETWVILLEVMMMNQHRLRFRQVKSPRIRIVVEKWMKQSAKNAQIKMKKKRGLENQGEAIDRSWRWAMKPNQMMRFNKREAQNLSSTPSLSWQLYRKTNVKNMPQVKKGKNQEETLPEVSLPGTTQ